MNEEQVILKHLDAIKAIAKDMRQNNVNSLSFLTAADGELHLNLFPEL